MKTLYAASAGSYSDYRVIAIFSTRQKAQAFKDKFPDRDWNDIEEYELDQHSSEIQRGLTYYSVMMYRDGEVIKVEVEDCPYPNEPVNWLTQGYWKPTKPWTSFSVWAKNEAQAIKISNEIRIRALASEVPSP